MSTQGAPTFFEFRAQICYALRISHFSVMAWIPARALIHA